MRACMCMGQDVCVKVYLSTERTLKLDLGNTSGPVTAHQASKYICLMQCPCVADSRCTESQLGM